MAKLGLGDARIGFLREELRSSHDRERFQSPGRRETRSNIRMIIIIMSTVWGRTGVRNDQALRPTHTHTHSLPGARAHRQSFSSGVCKRRYPQDRRPPAPDRRRRLFRSTFEVCGLGHRRPQTGAPSHARFGLFPPRRKLDGVWSLDPRRGPVYGLSTYSSLR